MPVSLYTTLDDPTATQGTLAWGINVAGQIVGWYGGNTPFPHGFLYSGGMYTTLDDPLATLGTFAYGINDMGQIVGNYQDHFGSGVHGSLAVVKTMGVVVIAAFTASTPGVLATITAT